MYEKFEIINGVLMRKTAPNGRWRKCTNEQCVAYFTERNAALLREQESMEDILRAQARRQGIIPPRWDAR